MTTPSTPRLDRLDQNLILNGNMFLAQRKPSGTVALTGSDAYGVFDRFVAQHNRVTSPTWEKEDLGSSLPLHQRYCAKFSGNFASGAAVSMSQRIESIVASLAYNENISIAFEVYSESCTHMRILGRVPTSIDNHATYNTAIFDQNVAISALGSWVEVKLENVSVGATVVNGLAITTNFINPSITGSTKLHKIRNLRVTIGANAASRFCFNGRNQADEERMCRRYLNSMSTGPGFCCATTTTAHVFFSYPSPMRVLPVLSMVSAFTLDDGIHNFTQSSASGNQNGWVATGGNSTTGSVIELTSFSGLTAYRAAMLYGGQALMSSEL